MKVRHATPLRLFAILLALSANLSTASASQIAFDYIVDNSHIVTSWGSVTTPDGSNYNKVGMPYQPSRVETIDHFSALMLGGLTSTNMPPDESNWALLTDHWRLRIWSVPASDPPVGSLSAINYHYWQTQPIPAVAPDQFSLVVNPVGGIPSRVGLSPSGKQKWFADFDLNSRNILLDPSRVYMFELSVLINSGAPFIYIFETDVAGPVGVNVSKTLTQPFPGSTSHFNGPLAERLTTNAVPEPSTGALAGIGLVGLAYFLRRRLQRRSTPSSMREKH